VCLGRRHPRERNIFFSGWVKTKDLTGDQGIRFHLKSVGNGRIPMATTRAILGTTPWTSVEQVWTAGPDVQGVEVCISREPSTNPGHPYFGRRLGG